MSSFHEIKVGAFILASISLLFFLILWLHKFDIASQLSLTARFKDTGALSQGTNVLCRGVKIGIVKDIRLSDDYQYALVKIDITNSKIKIYEGSTALVLDRGFTGNKVVSIIPPDDIKGKKVLKDDDIIEGKRSITIEEIEKILSGLQNDGTLEILATNSVELLESGITTLKKLNETLDKLNNIANAQEGSRVDRLMDDISRMSNSLNTASKSVNNFISDKELTGNVKETIIHSKLAATKISNITDKAKNLLDQTSSTINKLDNTVTNIDQTFNDPNSASSIKKSMEKFSSAMTNIESLTDEDMKNSIKETLKSSSNALNELQGLNCFTKEVGKTLSKPLLIPRLMFGRPGARINKCMPSSQAESK